MVILAAGGRGKKKRGVKWANPGRGYNSTKK